MTNILSIPGVKVSQKDYHQIIVRGNGLEKFNNTIEEKTSIKPCLLYTSPSPRDKRQSRMPSSA